MQVAGNNQTLSGASLRGRRTRADRSFKVFTGDILVCNRSLGVYGSSVCPSQPGLAEARLVVGSGERLERWVSNQAKVET